MQDQKIRVETIVSAGFQENTYIAYFEGKNECLVVDPGLEPDKILDFLRRESLEPGAILNTHGHSDHIAGNGALKEAFPDCPLVIGTLDEPMLTDADANLSAPYGFSLTSPPADVTVNEGDRYSAAGFDLDILHIPGHTTGHVVFVCRQETPALAFVGDVIFAGSIGRSDFPGGDHEQLISGIRTKLYALPDDTVLLSGHGPVTTVGREKQTNPFVKGE